MMLSLYYGFALSALPQPRSLRWGSSKHFYSLFLLPKADLLLGLLNENWKVHQLRALAALEAGLGLVPNSWQHL